MKNRIRILVTTAHLRMIQHLKRWKSIEMNQVSRKEAQELSIIYFIVQNTVECRGDELFQFLIQVELFASAPDVVTMLLRQWSVRNSLKFQLILSFEMFLSHSHTEALLQISN